MEHYGGGRSSEELHDLYLQAEDFTGIRHIVHETDPITAGVIGVFPAELSPEQFTMLHIADLSHVRAPVIVATRRGRPIPAAAAAFITQVTTVVEHLRVSTGKKKTRRRARRSV
jgi:hypothetical protein